MNHILLKSLSIFCLFVCLAFNKSYSQPGISNNDFRTIKKMEYDWLMAEFRLDTASIATMMDEKFMAIGLTGVSNKQQELNGIYENMRERLKNNHVVDSLYLQDLHIEFFENTAIVSFVSVTNGRIKDVPFNNRRTRMYDVWIKRNGKWKAISSQVSPIK